MCYFPNVFKKESVKQSILRRKYNVKNFAEHRAIGDIQALEQVYIRLCEQFSILKDIIIIIILIIQMSN